MDHSPKLPPKTSELLPCWAEMSPAEKLEHLAQLMESAVSTETKAYNLKWILYYRSLDLREIARELKEITDEAR